MIELNTKLEGIFQESIKHFQVKEDFLKNMEYLATKEEIINLSQEDRQKIFARVIEAVRMPASASEMPFWASLLSLNVNDRLVRYQMFKEMEKFYFFDDSLKVDFPSWDKIRGSLLENTHVFELEENLINILINTKSQYLTKMPFPCIFISGDIKMHNRTYLGLLVFRLTNAELSAENNDERIQVISFFIEKYFAEDKNSDEFSLKFDYYSLGTQERNIKRKELSNFIRSFCAFCTEPEVEIINPPLNPKNNERRRQRGLVPLPPNPIIRISGKLRAYIDSVANGRATLGSSGKFTHRFWVRGSFIHLWNKERYNRLYSYTEEELKSKGYSLQNGTIRVWRKPHIKGQGILIKKVYEVRK